MSTPTLPSPQRESATHRSSSQQPAAGSTKAAADASRRIREMRDSMRDSSKQALNNSKQALNNSVQAINAAYGSARTAFKDWGVSWPTVIWIGVVHVLAVIAPFFFSWPALLSCIALIVVTGSFGVCMGYHRLLTHKSFQTYRPIRWLLAFFGGLSGEGSALMWVANHRKHHAFSDHEGDPHSPKDGPWWSHMLWFMPNFGRKWQKELFERYAPDMLKDKMIVVLHYLFLPSHLACGLVLWLIGAFGPESWGLGSNWAGWSMVLWGMGVRMVYVLHVTWFVNSASHLWGYRNYETTDNSRNLWWVGLLAFGEGWHNNHHAYQRVARQGHRWWEIDVTYWCIWMMEKVGLAWDVIRVKDIPKGIAH